MSAERVPTGAADKMIRILTFTCSTVRGAEGLSSDQAKFNCIRPLWRHHDKHGWSGSIFHILPRADRPPRRKRPGSSLLCRIHGPSTSDRYLRSGTRLLHICPCLSVEPFHATGGC